MRNPFRFRSNKPAAPHDDNPFRRSAPTPQEVAVADALSDEPADMPAQVRQPVPAGELSDSDVVVSDEGQGLYLGGGLALVNGQRVSLSSLTNPAFYRLVENGQ